MECDVRVPDETVTIRVWGEATSSAEWERLNNTIHDLLKKGHRQFVLDLRLVSYLDSAGLGALVCAYVMVRRQGGEWKLRGIPGRHLEKLWPWEN